MLGFLPTRAYRPGTPGATTFLSPLSGTFNYGWDSFLYSSHLTTWRKAAHSGSLKALSKKRGRKPERNPLDEKVRKLERRNARLENELRKAHLIIDVQGKVAGLLGISLDDGTNS